MSERQPGADGPTAMNDDGPSPAVAPIGVPLQVLGAVLGASLAVMMLLRFGISWELPAYAYMAALAVALGIIDFKFQLLPNRYVYPGMLLAPLLVGLAAVGNGTWNAFFTALLGGAAMFVLYLVMALISPAGIGMGDVKLALVLGVLLGFHGWGTWFIGLFAAFLIGGLAGVVLLATGKAKRGSAIPFGPPMLAGALIAVLWGESLSRALFPYTS
ncbi:prepilin peptidase [Arthrobacter castelli]|uniref:prepilin peptidase n=1 Tax=Arthrobacter castelli TaxID=271431 RepID=UPI00040004D8|nr:A24 family peptidase [Arthrobacter castelli]